MHSMLDHDLLFYIYFTQATIIEKDKALREEAKVEAPLLFLACESFQMRKRLSKALCRVFHEEWHSDSQEALLGKYKFPTSHTCINFFVLELWTNNTD